MRHARGIVLTLVILLTATAARADCENDNPCDIREGLAMVPAFGVSLPVGLGGVTSLVGGAVDLAGHRHHRGWRISNFTFGALNIAAAAIWAGITYGRPQAWEWSLVGGHLALGIADLGVGGAEQEQAYRDWMSSQEALERLDRHGGAVPSGWVAVRF